MKLLACLAMTIGCLLGTATPSQAQPTADDIIAALSEDQIYHPPDAHAVFDEARVRAALTPATRILFVQRSGLEHRVDGQIDRWVEDNGFDLIVVNGLSVYGRDGLVWPDSVPQLRQVIAYSDITGPLLTAVRGAGGRHDTPVQPTASIPPTEAQVAAVVARLTESPVFNDPGREFPIDMAVLESGIAQRRALRIAAFPAVAAGAAVVDYAPALAEHFPDEVIFVVHGAWLDVAGPDQALVESVRDYAYGAQTRIPGDANEVVGVATERLDLLRAASRFGEPQQGWEPSLFRRWAVEIVIFVAVGSAALFLVVVLAMWRQRRRLETREAQLALRSASGSAMASIGRLAADVLATEMKGGRVRSDVAERLATARALYDQAFTAAAMREVKKVADEGLALGRSGHSDDVVARRPRKRVKRRVATTTKWTAPMLGIVASYLLFMLLPIVLAVTDERPPGSNAEISNVAKQVAAELQLGPVHVAPGSSGDLDPTRARELIGDRPLLVAAVHDTGGQPIPDLCDDITQVRVMELVIVLEDTPDGDTRSAACVGYGDSVVYSRDATAIVSDMRNATRFREGVDAGDTLEALVRAYDVKAVERYRPQPVPRRSEAEPPPPPPGKLSYWPLFPISGIPLAMVVLVGVVRRQGNRWIARRQRAQVAHTRSEESEARLNRLAEAILHPARPADEREARQQAELAEKYVLFLRDHEAGEAGEAGEERLSELEREVTR